MVEVKGTQVASAELKGVSTATEGVGTATEETSKKTSAFRQTLKGLATGFAVYKGAQFIKSAVTETASLAKATAGLQRVTGLDTKTAAGWIATANERGISSKTLSVGMATLGRNLQGVQKGSKASIQAFQQLGISQNQLKGADTQKVLGLISDGLSKVPPGAQKAADAQKLLGRSGTQLLPILNDGSKALTEQVNAMGKQTGITSKTLKSGLDLVKQQREYNAAMLGFKVAVGTALIPVLSGLAKALLPVMQTFAKLLQQSPLFRTAVYALAAALTALKVAMFFGASVGTGGWIGLLIAVGVALVTAYNKVKWFRDAVNAAFDFIKAHWHMFLLLIPGLGPLLSIIAAHFQAFKGVAIGVFNAISGAVRAVSGAISAAFHAGVSAAEAALHGIEGVAKAVWGAIESGARAIGSVVSGVFNGVKSIISSILSMVNQVISAAGKVGSVVSSITHAPSKVTSFLGSLNPFGAEGGEVTHAGSVLVGERGPEVVNLPRGSNIIPNHALGVSSGAIIHTHIYLDRREIAHALGNYTADQQAAR